jgi:hypothetical protein
MTYFSKSTLLISKKDVPEREVFKKYKKFKPAPLFPLTTYVEQ